MSRTIIAAIISIITGLFVALGSPLPPETVTALSEHSEAILGSVMALYGVVMVIFRQITTTPLVSLLFRGKEGAK